jgi:hypothetical protein
VAEIKFLLILTAEVIDSINFTSYCYKVNRDKGEILEDLLKIKSPGGDYCSPTEVDKVPDSTDCDDCSFY